MYIAKENHKQEIHLKGYEPVYDQHQDYADKNNFVWGLEHGEFLIMLSKEKIS